MSFTRHECVEIRCDTCSEPLPIFDDVGAAHFRSEPEAVSAAADFKWQTSSGRHECRRCAEIRVCAAAGHEPRHAVGEDVSSFRWCGRCYQPLPSPPAEASTAIGGV